MSARRESAPAVIEYSAGNSDQHLFHLAGSAIIAADERSAVAVFESDVRHGIIAADIRRGKTEAVI
jgi:hypothetical protein